MPYLFLFREKRCDEIGWSGIVYRISVRAKCKYRRKAVCFGQRGEVKRRLEFKLDGNLTYACNDGRFTRSRLFFVCECSKEKCPSVRKVRQMGICYNINMLYPSIPCGLLSCHSKRRFQRYSLAQMGGSGWSRTFSL